MDDLRFKLALAFRDWVHESPLSKCGPGADECPDWPKAYELADIALSALDSGDGAAPPLRGAAHRGANAEILLGEVAYSETLAAIFLKLLDACARVPIKQRRRTPEQQAAVEAFTAAVVEARGFVRGPEPKAESHEGHGE